MRICVVATVALLLALAAGASDIPLSTAVRFNTVCARCHEGECSGRMSFDLGRQAGMNHVMRYVGEVSPDTLRDYYALLAHMKNACAYHPLAVAVPSNGIWPAHLLASLRSQAGDAYFIPVGELSPGRYRAALRFDGAAEACAQVISDTFEIAEYPGLRADGGGADFVFVVERKGAHYLRLQTGKAAVLVGLGIAALP